MTRQAGLVDQGSLVMLIQGGGWCRCIHSRHCCACYVWTQVLEKGHVSLIISKTINSYIQTMDPYPVICKFQKSDPYVIFVRRRANASCVMLRRCSKSSKIRNSFSCLYKKIDPNLTTRIHADSKRATRISSSCDAGQMVAKK